MKTVFTGREIPLLWAHQTQAYARGGNMSFDGPMLRSYSTIIARLFEKRSKGTMALLSEHRYSITTAQHINGAARAVSHLPSAFVPMGSNGDVDHAASIAHFLKSADEALAKGKRAMSASVVEWRRADAEKYLATAAEYAKFFGIRRKIPAFPAADWDAAVERARAIENPDPVRDAKRFKAREQREAAKERRMVKLRAEYEALQAAAVVESASKIAAWRARETNSFNTYIVLPESWSKADRRAITGYTHAGLVCQQSAVCLLRVNGDQIETSKGARIPLDHAPRIWALVQACRSSGRGYQRNGHTEHAGGYAIDSIAADGTLHAGCHTIAYSELELIAGQLGLAV